LDRIALATPLEHAVEPRARPALADLPPAPHQALAIDREHEAGVDPLVVLVAQHERARPAEPLDALAVDQRGVGAGDLAIVEYGAIGAPGLGHACARRAAVDGDLELIVAARAQPSLAATPGGGGGEHPRARERLGL